MSILAVIAHHARRTVLRYKTEHPWTSLLLDGLGHLQALTGSIDTRLLPPVHHAPEGRTLWPPERPDHRETTRGKPSHPTGIIPATTPATTPPNPTQPTNERSRLGALKDSRSNPVNATFVMLLFNVEPSPRSSLPGFGGTLVYGKHRLTFCDPQTFTVWNHVHQYR